MDYAFGVVCKTSLPYPGSSMFSPVLSSRSFIALHFTFRFVIHFELYFVKGIRFVSRLIFLQVYCPVVSAPFVEKTKIVQFY